MRKTLSMLFTLAVVVAPAVAHAEKPFRINSTGVGASLGTSVGLTASLSIAVEQVTDQTGLPTTSLELHFNDTADQNFGGKGTMDCFNASFPVYLDPVSQSKKGETLRIDFLSASLPFLSSGLCICTGPACSSSISLTFTRGKHTYRFSREGSEHGVLADGTHIEDTFKETFVGADVTGTLFGLPLLSGGGQLATFRGDPGLK